MNIVEKTNPDFIRLDEDKVLFHYENGKENEFINFLKEKEITFETFCRPSKLINITINIDDYLSILQYIVNIEKDKYTSSIHLNDAVIHINNVGSGHCDKIEVDPNNMNVYRNGEEIFSIFWDIHEINRFSLSTKIGDKRYGPEFIPLKWFENEFKAIGETIDFENDN